MWLVAISKRWLVESVFWVPGIFISSPFSGLSDIKRFLKLTVRSRFLIIEVCRKNLSKFRTFFDTIFVHFDLQAFGILQFWVGGNESGATFLLFFSLLNEKKETIHPFSQYFIIFQHQFVYLHNLSQFNFRKRIYENELFFPGLRFVFLQNKVCASMFHPLIL